MKNENNDIEEIDQEELPVIGSIQVQRNTGYGTVPDLDGEEPADIAELQRITAWTMYGPLFELKGRGGHLGYPVFDENGAIDWERVGPVGDRTGLKQQPAQGRREELARIIAVIGLLNERVPGTEKYLVLKYARMGILQPDHIIHPDLRAAAQLEAYARRLQAALAGRTPGTRGTPEQRQTTQATVPTPE